MSKDYFYKNFAITKKGNKWIIISNGIELRVSKTLKECKQRIDNQTV